MEIKYSLIFFIYFPVLLLLITNSFKDRFELQNNNLRLCNWPLSPTIVMVFYLLSANIIKSYWYANLIPILNEFPYNLANVKIFDFFYYCFSLILVYLLLRYAYRVRIAAVFDFNLVHFPLILKVCGILAVIHILAALGTWKSSFRSSLSDIKLIDTHYVILFLFVAIVIAPIVEEIVFRGLLYGPLYRKAGRRFAIILSSLIWTFGHPQLFYPSIDISAIGIFILGIILAWLYDRSGSLFAPIIVHIFQNSWILIYLLKWNL